MSGLPELFVLDVAAGPARIEIHAGPTRWRVEHKDGGLHVTLIEGPDGSAMSIDPMFQNQIVCKAVVYTRRNPTSV